jgi:hypothetical protein
MAGGVEAEALGRLEKSGAAKETAPHGSGAVVSRDQNYTVRGQQERDRAHLRPTRYLRPSL